MKPISPRPAFRSESNNALFSKRSNPGKAFRKGCIDGFISTAGALIAAELNPLVREYIIAAHQSVEIGHRKMPGHLKQVPLLPEPAARGGHGRGTRDFAGGGRDKNPGRDGDLSRCRCSGEEGRTGQAIISSVCLLQGEIRTADEGETENDQKYY
jgi:hypothetical protein